MRLLTLVLALFASLDHDTTNTSVNPAAIPASVSHAESLVAAVEQLHAGMKAPDRAQRMAALKRILPTRDDFETLFPGHGQNLWAMIQPRYDQMLQNIDPVAAELTRHEWIKIEPIDVRHEKDEFLFEGAED